MTEIIKPSELTDEHRLDSVWVNHSAPYYLRCYDDSWGELYVVQEPCGHFGRTVGVIRARFWHEAYDIATDEILDDASSEEYLEAAKDQDIPFDTDDYGNSYPQHDPEGFGSRGNGEPTDGALTSALYQADPGWQLNPLTDQLAEDLNLSVHVETEPS